jgi:competence protein ComEC
MRYFLAPYPALRLLAVVVAGIAAGFAFAGGVVFWIVLALSSFLVMVFAFVFCMLKKRATGLCPVTILFYLLFVFSVFALLAGVSYHYVPLRSLIAWSGKNVILAGEVSERPECSAKGAAFQLRVREVYHAGSTTSLDDRAAVFVRLQAGSSFIADQGDRVRVKGRLGLIPPAANAGEYDPRRQSRFRQVYVRIYCAGPWHVILEKKKDGFSFHGRIITPLRKYIAESIDGTIPGERERQFLKGMILGQRDLLQEELYDAFRRTGTAHVLAVSGLHVALLAFGINACLQRLKVTPAGRWISFILLLAVLAVYSSVTGNAPSVQRAAIMSLVLIGGEALGRKAYPVNSLAASDVLILLFDPMSLFNPGFIMTNAAVLGILALYEPLGLIVPAGKGLLRKMPGLLWKSFSVTLAAMAGVAPVIAWFFGTFSLAGIFANLPVVLFSNLAMYAVLPMLLFNGFASGPALLFGMSAFVFAQLTLFFTVLFNRMPMANIPVHPASAEVLIIYAALAAVVWSVSRRAWGMVVTSVLLAANLLLWYEVVRPRPHPPGILTVNLGRNLATLVCSGSETVLVDAGRSSGDMERILLQVDRNGLMKPSAVVQFLSPDTLVRRAPAQRRMPSDSSSLLLSTIVVSRPAENVLRIESRKGRLLLVSGLSRIEAVQEERGAVVMIWAYRFAGKHYRELETWFASTRPERLILVPGPFLSSAEKGLLERFAATHPETLIRSRTGQIVIR